MTVTPLSTRAAIQIRNSAARIPDPREAEQFLAMMLRAADLAQESKRLRIAAWSKYRELTGLQKGMRSYA
jgi:hypothetical protein